MAGGIPVPVASIQQPTGDRAPQQNTYRAQEHLGGRIQGRFDGGPEISGAVGAGLRSLGAGLGDLGEAWERETQRRQNLEAMQNVQKFQDEEREALAEMSRMEGQQGIDEAIKHMDNFYATRGEELMGKARGRYQELYYQDAVGRARDQGLNQAVKHSLAATEAMAALTLENTMANNLVKLGQNPADWDAIIMDTQAAIDVAFQHQPNDAKKIQASNDLAVQGVTAAMLANDFTSAQAMANRITDPAARARLGEQLQTMETNRVVDLLVQDGLVAMGDGQALEQREAVMDLARQGKISPDVAAAYIQKMKVFEEQERETRTAGQKAEESQAFEKMLELRAGSGLTVDWLTGPEGSKLPADVRERVMKELQTDAAKVIGMNSVKGREIDAKVRTAIANGDIQRGDETAIRSLVNELDPEARYVQQSDIGDYIEFADDIGPLAKVFEYITNTYYKNDPAGAYHFQERAMFRLGINNKGYTDPESLAMVQEWAENPNDTDVPDKWLKQEWYLQDPTLWPEVVSGAVSLPASSGTAGASGGIFSALAAGPGALADLATRPEIQERFARDTALRQGLPNTPFSVKWAQDALDAGKTTREVAPKFAQGWAGKGEVTLTGLGRVNDYDAMVKKHALSQGIDPNLLAAMMYVESGGDRMARSEAGAVGLMQFMPKTAAQYGVGDRTDPEQSIRGAAKYMRDLLDMFDGKVAMAVMAYNAGPGTIRKGSRPAETKKYVDRVMALYTRAGGNQQPVGQLAGVEGLRAPLEQMLVTSRFGPRNTGIAGASTNHQGLDLRAPVGTPVSTVLPGVVIEAGYEGKSGHRVVVDHGHGRRSYYLHLSAIDVKKGQRVGGDTGILVVGRSGNSGDFKKPLAPHLDFRFWDNGKFIDPATLYSGLKYKAGV